MTDNVQFQIFSDIHTELNNNWPVIEKKCDNLILAGDIGKLSMSNFKAFMTHCSNLWVNVFYVFGNHEFYSKRSMETLKKKYTEYFNTLPNVHLLDSSSYTLNINNKTVTLYGFTAWTHPITKDSEFLLEHLNDYTMIKTKEGKLTPEYIENLVVKEKEAFQEFLLNDKSDIIVVVTHFPPTNKTSHPMYKNCHLQNYFRWNDYLSDNNIENFEKIKIWCSGHTHYSYDFTKYGIRYKSNQVGYLEDFLNETSFCDDGLFTIDLN